MDKEDVNKLITHLFEVQNFKESKDYIIRELKKHESSNKDILSKSLLIEKLASIYLGEKNYEEAVIYLEQLFNLNHTGMS